jgi:hypothetical protein
MMADPIDVKARNTRISSSNYDTTQAVWPSLCDPHRKNFANMVIVRFYMNRLKVG